MKFSRKLTHAVVAIACIGMVIPQSLLAAPRATAPVIKARDVALNASGNLTGVVVTSQGKMISGTQVALMKDDHTVVASATTNANGEFSFAKVKSGSYMISVREGTDQKVTAIRVWKSEVAPPNAAHKLAFMTMPQNAVRGQDPNCPPEGGYCPPHGVLGGLDIITLWTLTAATGALVLGAINQADLKDIKDQLNQVVSP